MTSRLMRWIAFILTNLIFLSTPFAQAQQARPYKVNYTDSLLADQGSRFLYNTLKINNLQTDSLPITITFSCPSGWQLLGTPEQHFTIGAKDTIALPLTIGKRNSSASTWQPFYFYIQSGSRPADTIRFHLRAQAFSAYEVSDLSSMVSTSKSHSIDIQLKLRNKGNVAGQYVVAMTNENIFLNQRIILNIAPGKDTNFIYTYTVPRQRWAAFNQEQLNVSVNDLQFIKLPRAQATSGFHQVSGTSSNPYFTTLMLLREDSMVKMHASANPMVKLSLETGYISFNQQSTYFGAVEGAMQLSANELIGFNYHSRQFGVNNILARDVFNVYYTSKHWNIHVGQVSENRFFRSFGNGISIGYRWGYKNEFIVFGTRHTPGYISNNDNGGLSLKLNFGKCVWNQSLVFNTDSSNKYNSYLYNTDLQLFKSRTLDASINAGIGMTQNMLYSSEPASTLSGFGGYRMSYRPGKWIIGTSGTYYGSHFVGYNQGARSLNGLAGYHWKRVGVEGFYLYDYRQNNFFRDSLYNSDILSYNIEKYGMRININTKLSSLSLSAGIISQTGQSNYSFSQKYNFLEFQYNYNARKYFHFSLSNIAGIAPINGPTALLMSSNGSASYRFLGINGGYNVVPIIEGVNDERRVVAKSETIYGGPYVSANFWNYFNASLQYSVSKTLYDGGISTFANITFGYENPYKGIRLTMNASSPLRRPDVGNVNPIQYGYFNLSLRKTLNVPFILKRKYPTLRARLFEDDNGNGIFDDNERPVKRATCMVNDMHFVTDERGTIRYKNIDKGNYTLNLNNAATQGFVPAIGADQMIVVRSNTQVDIPFRKARTVSGKLTIIQDSISEAIFYPGNIKVEAIDSQHHYFSALTDANGHYFMNLPAGVYTVSLNPEAFNSRFKPVHMSYELDLEQSENGTIDFTIKQRRRELKIMKMAGEVTATASKEVKPAVGNVPLTQKEKAAIKDIYDELAARRGVLVPKKEKIISVIDLAKTASATVDSSVVVPQNGLQKKYKKKDPKANTVTPIIPIDAATTPMGSTEVNYSPPPKKIISGKKKNAVKLPARCYIYNGS